MGRKFSVEKLPLEQKDFIMHLLLDGLTDGEIRAKVNEEYGIDLKNSSFARWRKDVGEILAERFKGKRFLVRSFVEKLKKEGVEINDDKYQQIIENLEDHLLTSERDLIAQNPLKLLFARQDDERLKIKREELEHKKHQLEFEREKFERTQNLQADRFKIGTEVWKYILGYFLKNEPLLADAMTAHSEQLLEGLGEHIEQIQTA